jgi:alpha/beta superfamily hydrolase
MHNKVVYHLYSVFARQGCAVLRFNFRGVGQSEGRWSGGEGELEDALACLNWMQTQAQGNRRRPLWLAGFSFGAWATLRLLARVPDVRRFVAVAPPVNLLDCEGIDSIPASGLILHGEQDALVPVAGVLALADRLNTLAHVSGNTITCRTLSGADHFFHGQATELSHLVSNYLKHALSGQALEDESFLDPGTSLDEAEQF